MENSQEWLIAAGAIKQIAAQLYEHKLHYSQGVIISNASVASLYVEAVKEQLQNFGMRVEIIILADGETQKNMENVLLCWEKMQAAKIDRHAVVFAVGGGVITDLAGFVANGYMRGIDLVLLPTSLMAMIDTSIGGKNGVNFHSSKNLIGTFYQPKLTLIDPLCLRTLPAVELRSGLAEVIKYGIIADADLFLFLEKHMQSLLSLDAQNLLYVIERSCQIKADIVAEDPYERIGKRAILNWGHTFGHAIESITQFCTFRHGEALAIGMSCAAHLSIALNLADERLLKQQDALCHAAQLLTELPAGIDLECITTVMEHDKKSYAGKITCIVSEGIGSICYPQVVDSALIRYALQQKQRYDKN